MDIIEIQAKCNDENIAITQHLMSRMRERNIRYDDVIAAVMSGEVIEDYPDAHPFPACLILGVAPYPLHVVCGLGNGKLFIITAYRPDTGKWAAGWKKRKETDR
jgi:hypothetical protein